MHNSGSTYSLLLGAGLALSGIYVVANLVRFVLKAHRWDEQRGLIIVYVGLWAISLAAALGGIIVLLTEGLTWSQGGSWTTTTLKAILQSNEPHSGRISSGMLGAAIYSVLELPFVVPLFGVASLGFLGAEMLNQSRPSSRLSRAYQVR